VYSPFLLYENRLKLLRLLRERGYYVRMHAYEYLVGNGKELVAIVILEPRLRKGLILGLSGSEPAEIGELRDLILSLDKGLELEIRLKGYEG